MSSRRIVVGVDESDGARAALRWATSEAGFDDADVTALMAWGWFEQHHLLDTKKWEPDYDEGEAHAALGRYVELAVGSDAADRVGKQVVMNLPGYALVEAAKDADLLVVGARGLGGFRGLLLGSVSQQCLHTTSVPIAIIREAPTANATPSRRVVAGVDGSDDAQRALRWAIAEARRRGAALDVIHAWQLPFLGYVPFGRPLFDDALIQDASEHLLAQAIGAEDVGGIEVKPISLRAATVAGILGMAEGADVLVVGCRGQGAIGRTLVGSVATQLSHHAPCPIVVVPHAASGPRPTQAVS